MEDPQPLSTTASLTDMFDDMQALRKELERLNAEVLEASEERAQAAEYGLVVLEEKQALQSQHEELMALYDSTRREMENSVATLKQVQADYEKRLRDVESQREQLLDEIETRETSLVNKNARLGEEIRQSERKLKRSLSEQDHLNEHNSFLTGELDRFRREADSIKEENCRLKQEMGIASKERGKLRKEVDRLEKRVSQLLKCEEDCSVLQEINKTLKNESQLLHKQFEGVRVEKEDLEYQNREAIQALNEEREAKSILETRLKEDSITSPAHPSWAIEKDRSISSPDFTKSNVGRSEQTFSSSTPVAGGSVPNSHTRDHSSTLFSPKPSLLSELQTSFLSSVDYAELDGLKSEVKALRLRCKEADDSVTVLQKEKMSLEEKVTSFSVEQAQANGRVDALKDEYSKMAAEREKVVESLKEDLLAKEETIGLLRNKVSSSSAEKASMGIEVDGLNDELQRIKQFNSDEMDKVQAEIIEEQTKNTELKSQIAVMEEQIVLFSNTVEKLENIISNSHYELTSMTDDLRNLHKTVVTLGVDGKVGSSGVRKLSRPITPLSNDGSIDEASENGSITDEAAYGVYYSLPLQHGRRSIQVHNESHSLHAIIQLHDQLRSVRLPLERFTKNMLERSLAHSAKKQIASGSDPSSPQVPTSPRRHSFHFETTLNKMRANLSHKNEEISNLRAIMKARSTTADVATSSLRSKLEGQARAYQTELTRLKHQIKTLKKDRDEHLSLRTMYAKRCENYIDEITKMKKSQEQMKFERSELMTSLQKTIQRKLDLSWELEEYKMEQERMKHIPKQLGSSRV